MSRMNVILSNKKNTFANKLAVELVPRLNIMSDSEIRNTIASYLNDETLSMSQESRKKYLIQMNKIQSHISLLSWIYNINLKTSGMGIF